jgi:RNA polymerase sigma factor (sigma-70 family)
MAGGQVSDLIQHLRRAVALDGAGMTDGQLLDCFVRHGDEAALAAIVRRHGPMVWGVCRRILRSHHDAEDAFQATFLVLVRRAASIQPSNRVGNWLYGVAHKSAQHARRTMAKRLLRERHVDKMPEPTVGGRDANRDLEALLDLELSRLPQRYRTAIVLCDLEGGTRRHVARQLGVPEGTLAGWLTRGRSMLARRLTRHGLAVSAGTLAVALSPTEAGAGLPASTMSAAITAASLLASGQTAASGAISARAAILMEGVLRTMLLNKLRSIATVLVVATILTAGAAAGLFAFTDAGDPSARTAPPAVGQAAKSDGKPTSVVVRDDASVEQLVFCDGGRTVAAVSMTWTVHEFKAGDEVKKGLSPNSALKLWDAGTGKLKSIPIQERNCDFNALALSADGKTAAIVVTNVELEAGKTPRPVQIRIVNPDTWETKLTLDEELKLGPGESVDTVALSPDGKLLAFGGNSPLAGEGAFMQIWDLAGKRLIGGTKKKVAENPVVPAPANIDVLNGRVMCVAFSPDGKRLAAGDLQGKLRIYEAETAQEKQVLDEDATPIMEVAFSPDGKLVAAVREAEIAPEDKAVANDGADRTLHLWDLETGKLHRKLKRDDKVFNVVAFSPDGKLLATGGAAIENSKPTRAEVLIWDTRTWEVKHLVPHGFPRDAMFVGSLAFSPDSQTLAIGGSTEGDLKDGGRTTGQLTLVPLHSLIAK